MIPEMIYHTDPKEVKVAEEALRAAEASYGEDSGQFDPRSTAAVRDLEIAARRSATTTDQTRQSK